MRLGVPFIAPRQQGAVESILGRLILPSVDWRTGQSGAHRTLSGARFLSFYGEADRWQPWSRWRTGHCPVHTGHCPVHTGQSGAPSRPLARPRVLRRSRTRPLARVGVLGPTAHPGMPLKVFLGVGRCRRL